ncbi:hypothetical protein EV360DRAFT_71098 [Lentinula raphanica]|nr:hypothetical protein EV360DRAFT_71098 [Lentinula raphanica]
MISMRIRISVIRMPTSSARQISQRLKIGMRRAVESSNTGVVVGFVLGGLYRWDPMTESGELVQVDDMGDWSVSYPVEQGDEGDGMVADDMEGASFARGGPPLHRKSTYNAQYDTSLMLELIEADTDLNYGGERWLATPPEKRTHHGDVDYMGSDEQGHRRWTYSPDGCFEGMKPATTGWYNSSLMTHDKEARWSARFVHLRTGYMAAAADEI